ncbi:MAG TPA: DUF3108 domain-containing protein [Terriglobales bacterium]|nr:DUF3108 domain-containing protein [Terriglobales bacterium]
MPAKPTFRISRFAALVLALSLVAISRAQKPTTQPSVTAAPEAQIIPPPAGYRFPDGQVHVFSVEWHLFTAGTAVVRMDPAGAQQRVTATADSQGVVNTLFKVHDHFEALFDPKTFCSLHVTKHTEEGPRKKDTDVQFDYARKKSVLNEKNLKTNETSHEETDIPGCLTDVVTGFYYVASLPLQSGSIYNFTIGDRKITQVRATVQNREQIKVPAGSFHTVKVQAEAVSGTLKGKGAVTVWYTDDQNHTPVQMRSKLGWGTLLFRLQRLEAR